MFCRLYQLLLILGFVIIYSIELDILLTLDASNTLSCYSCKGSECENVKDNDENKIICNRATQLCWAGLIDRKPHRMCANRYCTPTDISLDNEIHIETCCRSNLCNSVSLSQTATIIDLSKTTNVNVTGPSHSDQVPSIPPIPIHQTEEKTDSNKNVNQETVSKDNSNHEEAEHNVEYEHELPFNKSDPNSFGIKWERQHFQKDFSVRIASISSVLVLLMPLLIALTI